VTPPIPRGFFVPGLPVTWSRAPGRLDLMGGVADYSGSVVLEAPLARATHCAVQPVSDDRLVIWSDGVERDGLEPRWEGRLSDALKRPGEQYRDVRHRLAKDARTAWVAYAAGVLTVLHAEHRLTHPTGLRVYLRSDVPLGAGVSSSASIEVAVMTAVATAYGLVLDGREIARLCQQVENQVVGAPCGIMDQATCALGEAGRLIAIRCRPCELLGHITLPAGTTLFGIHSGVKHSVGGSRYARARVGAFMGLKIIRSLPPFAEIEYLCDLNPLTFRRHLYGVLPSRIQGSRFLELYGETDDPVTRVESSETYAVRGAVEHAVYENDRVQRFIELLARAEREPEALPAAGRLMYGSHWSYGCRIGLGAAETDLLVRLARTAGVDAGLYGAKITGGGSGGTVALLATAGARPTVEAIAAAYSRRSGYEPEILEGTSPGAVAHGIKTVLGV
jgi:galactokinase